MASEDPGVLTLQVLEARVFKLEEPGRHVGCEVDELKADVHYLKEENTRMKKTLLPLVWAKLREHKADVERLGPYMAEIVEKAAEVSWGKLVTMQQEADTRQYCWHTAVTEDLRTAHERIEEQVKELSRNAEAATKATHAMICQEVVKMNALNENLLGRLDLLSTEHEAVQATLKDVTSRQRHLAKRGQTIGVGEIDAEMSQRSYTTTSSNQSCRRQSSRGRCDFKPGDSDVDTDSQVQDDLRRLSIKVRNLTGMCYKQKHYAACAAHRARSGSFDQSRDECAAASHAGRVWSHAQSTRHG